MVERLRGRRAVVQRKRRMERTRWLCERCEAKGLLKPAAEVDHVKPLSLGGGDEDGNTQNLCRSCHDDKTRQDFGHKSKPTISLSGWPE